MTLTTRRQYSASTKKMKKKKKKKEETTTTTTTTTNGKDAPPSSLLSFDDLEDADVEQPFKIKKSKESRRLERELKKEKKLEKARKKLEEIDASAVKKENADSDEDDAGATYIDAGDIRIKVKSFNVPATSNNDVKPVVKKEEIKDEYDDEDDDDKDDAANVNGMKYNKPSGSDRFGAARRQAEGAGLQRMLEEGKIPDAALIHAVRKRRQQLAQGGGSGGGSSPNPGGEDYVPLQSNAASSSAAAASGRPRPAGASRLVTEEQEYDEDMMRPMKFAVNQEATQRQEIRDNFMAAEHGSDDGSDDHEDNEALRRWEREQIKKGFTGVANGAGGGSGSPSGGMESMVGGTYYGFTGSADPLDVVTAALGVGAAGSANGSSDAALMKKLGTSKCDSISDVKKRIQGRVDAFEDVRRSHRNELESLEDSLALTEHSIHTHESDVKRLEKKYSFFQEMRCYATDLVDCVNEKLPKIEALEASVHALWRKRAEKLSKRYQADIKDMAAQYSANPTKNFDAETRKRIYDREARRTRRKQARASAAVAHEDGLSTDDEEAPAEIDQFQTERLRLVESASEIWSDVVEDFYKLDVIKSRFEEWKKTQSDSYQNAFISFCLPGLFAPFARLHMIGWSPFRVSSSSPSVAQRRVEEALSNVGQAQQLEDFEWFQSLMMFNADIDHLSTSMGELTTENGDVNGEKKDDDDGDDDFKILPRVLEKVMVPKLAFFVEDAWNPMSSKQTKIVANLLRHLVEEYPSIHMDSKPVQALVKSVVLRLKRTLNEDIYMPLYSKDAITDPHSDTYVFFHRQLWSCVKLFGNMFEFADVLGVGQLQEMAFDSLLNRYVMIGLLTLGMNKAGLTKCRAVVDRIPEKWLKKVVKVSRANQETSSSSSSSTYPPLENFAKHVKNSSVTFGKDKQGEGETAFREAREIIKQAAYLLCDIYADDHAKVLSELFSFKI